MSLSFPEFSYKNILHACAVFSSLITTNEVLNHKCGQESLAIVPAFTAVSLSGLKFAYDNGFNSRAFVFGATTTMAYAVSDIVKGCGYYTHYSLRYSRGSSVNAIMLGLSAGMASAIVFGGICHGAYRLAEYLDGNNTPQNGQVRGFN